MTPSPCRNRCHLHKVGFSKKHDRFYGKFGVGGCGTCDLFVYWPFSENCPCCSGRLRRVNHRSKKCRVVKRY
jgi:hypothetical protein